MLRDADVAFGNCEEPIASVGFMYQKTSQMAWPPILDDLKAAGFNMLSGANNHYMDLGRRGFAAGPGRVAKRGFAIAGAGKNLDEALKPGIRTVKGVRVGLLAFWCNQAGGGYADYARAAADKPGVAMITGAQVVIPDGSGVRTAALPQAADLRVLGDAIARARSQVDFLMVVVPPALGQRGLAYSPGNPPPNRNIVPADPAHPTNQVVEGRRIICHAAIDAGADAIVGHGPHVLNGIEVYKGKPIIYSLGHYYMEITHDGKALPQFGFDRAWCSAWRTTGFSRSTGGRRLPGCSCKAAGSRGFRSCRCPWTFRRTAFRSCRATRNVPADHLGDADAVETLWRVAANRGMVLGGGL